MGNTDTAWTSAAPGSASSGAEAARTLLERLRGCADNRWLLLLAGPVCAAALVIALLQQRPDTTLADAADGLGTATARLGWTVADGAEDETQRELALLRQRLATLRGAAASGGLVLHELDLLESRLAGLGPRAGRAELRAVADLAERVTAQARQEMLQRQARLGLWLQLLSATLALTLLLPAHGLWRQRRRMRRALREFSDTLARGAESPPADTAEAGVSARRWRALADLSADWYWESDEQMRLSWSSGSSPLTTQLGWTLDELIGRRRDELPAFEPPALGWDWLNERMARRQPFRDVELRARSRRGDHALWIALSGRPRHDAEGRFTGYEGVGRDITERKLGYERQRENEQRWALMVDLASDWYWETDAAHRLQPVGRAVYRSAVDYLEPGDGRTRWELHTATPPELWERHRADLDTRRPFRSFEFPTEARDGGTRWVSLSGIARFDGQGRFLGYRGVGRDITVRKQAEAVLRRDNEALQQAVAERTRELQQINRDLDAFSRQLAHELRTPIGHVEGIAQLLSHRAAARLDKADRELLAMQEQAARTMRETLDALMLLARSTVQAMPMDSVDLSALAQDAATGLPALERRAPLHWEIEPGLRVHGCAPALRIVLANLLGNAAKFTRRVEAPTVRVAAAPDADGRLRVTVEDNGAGFDPALADRLFVPFNRLHAGEDYAGTGVGLSIVQRIVERHGGTVAAHGAPGRGARFEFTLAAAAD
ncbi:sensor histidine kinase [Rubrivivax benzoatilyticus]|uniref:histidine kinase n=1 Tax=Rubrivivax benzoatilyticus TaxID=316997 RepID=A0ABX0I173_9BURK|nr:ATP-binding protein [Rubrivivax benzoatilyticus]EGJ12277.1 putative two-component system sensor protein [Rubrivivax benzoatilyticus JA2 = ATCC BAA-35]NHK99882.1 PAS domain S-box protein [Rubrivivax benzoatilyticus]NHL25839.1 PAS domain S-box protein [Rubrivivax benzoatilyticus]